MNVFKVTKHRDHHGRGGGVADPHGEEGGGKHEPEHQVGWTRSLAVRKFSTVSSFKYVSLPQKKLGSKIEVVSNSQISLPRG